MNIFRTSVSRALALALALPLAAFVIVGCDVGSTDSTTAVVSDNDGTIYNFSGLYMNPDNDTGSTNSVGILPIVYPYQQAGRRPSGELITFLRLLQYGSALEAYDSAGLTWSGSISVIQSGTASFSLKGRTTVGNSVEIAGTLTYADQESTLDATWIEPSYYGNIYAQATVAPSATNSPVVTNGNDNVTITPTSTTLTTNGAKQVFYADGGNGSFEWSYTSSNGSLSSTTGASITFTRISSGTGVLYVSSDGDDATAIVTCP